MSSRKILVTRLKLALATGLFVGNLYVYDQQINNVTVIPANDCKYNVDIDDITNRDITVDDVRYKIYSSPLMTNWILQKLTINPNLKNRLVINEMHAIYENFDKVYKIEIKEDIKDNNILNPKTYTETKMVLN